MAKMYYAICIILDPDIQQETTHIHPSQWEKVATPIWATLKMQLDLKVVRWLIFLKH